MAHRLKVSLGRFDPGRGSRLQQKRQGKSTMNTDAQSHRLIFVTTIAALFCLIPRQCPAAPIEHYRTGIDLNFLGLTDGMLFWKSDCGEPGFASTRLVQSPSGGGVDRTVYAMSCSGGGASRIVTEAARDTAGYYYWVTGLGQVNRANSSLPSLVANSPDGSKISVNAPVAVSDNYVYWSEQHGFELSLRSRIFRAPKTGGAPSLVVDFTGRTGREGAVRMDAHDDNLVTVLTDGQNLRQFWRVFISLPPPGAFVWQESLIATNVVAAAVNGGRIFWAERSTDERSLFFRSAPVDNAADRTLHHLAFQLTPHSTRVLAVDGVNLYYQDLTGGNGPIVRKALAGGLAEEITDPLGYQTMHLVTDGHYVFWRNGDHTVSRLPVNAAAVTRDLAVTGLEIVQAVQNDRNEAPLVLGKATFVRLYAQLSSSDGATELDLWPGAVLQGSRDGVALPGSPLRPERRQPIRNVSSRTSLDSGFLFHLPDSWTRQGQIALRGVVNPERVVRELDFANNTWNETADFLRKSPMCLVMHPTRTIAGTLHGPQPRFLELFDYLEALMPASALQVHWSSDLLEEKDGVFGGYGPYEVSAGDDDGDRILLKLRRKKMNNPRSYSGAANGYDHYSSLLAWPHPSPAPWTGKALVGRRRIAGELNIRPSSIVFASTNRNSFDVLNAATTYAQEVGHNYGRHHVDCGTPRPKSIDEDFPYDPCKLSSDEAGFIGFDPIRRQLMLANEVTDYMSYQSPKWVSDYTWRNLIRAMGNLPGSVALPAFGGNLPGAGGMSPASASLILGTIHPETGEAGMEFGFEASGTTLTRALEVFATEEPSEDFELVARDIGNNTVGVFPVIVDLVEGDEGAGHSGTFLSVIDLPSSTVRLDFGPVGGSALASLTGGGARPTVVLSRPLDKEAIPANGLLAVEWTATDPEGAPMLYMVRYTHDNGTSWMTLTDDYPSNRFYYAAADLPGGIGTCRVEVSASDGLRSASVVSGPFTVPPKAPNASLYFETLRGRNYDQPSRAEISPGDAITFRGHASDLEDGPLPDHQLSWRLSGSVERNHIGPTFELEGLSPGEYLVDLAAVDSTQQPASARASLVVFPKFVETSVQSLRLDGYADDPAYREDHAPLVLRYDDGRMAEVRCVHQGNRWWMAASGLSIGAAPFESFALFLAVGTPQQGIMLRFQVHADGTVRTFSSSGNQWVEDPGPVGLQARVSRGEQSWTAELCIDDSRVNGWKGQTVKMALAHLDRHKAADDTWWPSGASANSPAAWAATVLGAALQSYRDGVAGYMGTRDTDVRLTTPDESFGDNPELLMNGAFGNPSGPLQGLLRFEGLIGFAPGQIPAGSMVESATLTLSIVSNPNTADTVHLHRLLVPWEESSTWNSLAGGILVDGLQALTAADASFDPNPSNAAGNDPSLRTVDVTQSVRAWVNGAANHGWALIMSGANESRVHSSESANLQSRPLLTVRFIPVSTPPAAKPILLVPPDLMVECQGSNGTPVTYSVEPIHFCSPNVLVSCAPPSASAFPVGSTAVQCRAADPCGNLAEATFRVTVVDTTPPQVFCPGNIVVQSLSSTGMAVNFSATASDNCGGIVPVTATPPSGSVFPVGMTTVTCTAADASGNVGTCSLQIVVNPPVPPAIVAHGLTYRPLGQAHLAVDPNGELLVSNLGSNGQDGFRVELGAAGGWEGEWANSPLGPGEEVHSTRIFDAFLEGNPSLLYQDRLWFNQQRLFVSADFSPSGVSTSRFGFFGQDVFSETNTGNHALVELPSMEPACTNHAQLVRRTIRPDTSAWALNWPPCSSGNSPRQIRYSLGYADGDPLFFGLDSAVFGEEFIDEYLSGPTSISAVEFAFQGVAPFRIRRASLRQFDQEHFALGRAMFQAESTTLSLTNIGSSGTDGVRIPLQNVPAFAVTLSAPTQSFANTSPGASLHFEGFGALGSTESPSYEGSLGVARFVFNGQSIDLFVDFGPIGQPVAVVEFFDQGKCVGTRTASPAQSAAFWPVWPWRFTVMPRDTKAFDGSPMYELSVDSPQHFVLPDQSSIRADRIRVRPQGAVDRLAAVQEVRLHVAKVPAVTIVGESSDRALLADIPETYAEWLAHHWLPDIPDVLKAPDADLDGDGVKNFVEYANGLDPMSPGRTGLPVVSVVPDGGGTSGALRFQFPIGAKDVRYRIFAADSLEEPVSWIELDDHDEDHLLSGVHREINIQDLIARERRFFKIDVEAVDPILVRLETEAPVLPNTGDSLRIGTYNTQFLGFGSRFGCCDDMPTRARRIAERIRATGFDIVSLCEAFTEDAKSTFIEELSNTYPHYVHFLSSRDGPVFQDSGLMLFSRHPFVELPPAAALFQSGVRRAVSAGMPWPSVAWTRFDSCHGARDHGSDCLAQKGVGLVRVQNTNTGRIYNVAFTHLDAGRGDLDALVRASQLMEIEQMLTIVLGSAVSSEDVFLLGDLNIRGENFWDDPEWALHFGTPGNFFTDILHDGWEPQVDLGELRPIFGGVGSRPDYRDHGLTAGIHDRGGSQSRKDYLLMSRSPARPPDRRPLRIQHMAVAFGLRDSPPVVFGSADGRFVPAAFGQAGRQDLSDHYGIIADLNLEADHCSPRSALANPSLVTSAGSDSGTVLRGTLVHPGSMHWYRFDQPGTYSIAIRSGNFTNHVYDSRQLSLPIRNYRGETRTLADSMGTAVNARIFDVPDSPLYIRVSHIHRTGRGDYELVVRRHEGNSPEDAIILTPNNNTRPYRVDFAPTHSDSPCRWFRLNTERADSGRSQRLTFVVRPFTSGSHQLSVVRDAVPRTSVCPPAGHILTERTGTGLIETELAGFAGGVPLFLVVRPFDRTHMSFEAGWDTDLTVIHPYVPGYCPGSATATSLTCREEQDGRDGPGDDRDVRMETAILSRDSEAVLVSRGPFFLLESWDKGRNLNVEEELGTIRFLPDEKVRVRLSVRDRPRDRDRLDGFILNLDRFEHRRCNTSLAIRGGGGRYDLNFHMSHGVPAVP